MDTEVDTKSAGLSGVGNAKIDELPLSDDLAWLRARIGKFVKGGVYLVAGQPGIGKSTLGIQLATDLARSGFDSVYILTEQSKEELRQRAELITSKWPTEVVSKAFPRIHPEDSLYDIDNLPSFLAQQILSPKGKYPNARLVILDSIQGQGLSATATKKYKQVYEFCRQCKSAGITVVLVAHVTKRGEIAGPKDLEHNVDCVLVMRKAMVYRPLFVPKNRFGPAVLKPIPLQMEAGTTALSLAPHAAAVSTAAKFFIGGDSPLAEVQAAVSLPGYGTRGRITAPGLPRKEIEQLANCISSIEDMNIEDLDYTIHCRLPGERRYRTMVGLPLAMALIASYLQKEIPAHHVYMGEIDLFRKVRDIPEEVLIDMLNAIDASVFPRPARVFLPPNSAAEIRGRTSALTVVDTPRLDEAVYMTWPELRSH